MTTSTSHQVTQNDWSAFHLDLLRKLDRCLDQEALFDTISQTIAHHVLFDRLEIALVDSSTTHTRVVFERGDSPGRSPDDDTLQTSMRAMTQSVVQDAISVLHTMTAEPHALAGETMKRAGAPRQLLISPVVVNGDVYGVVKVYSKDADRFDATTATMVESSSRMLGLAIAAQQARKVPRLHPLNTDNVLADISSRIVRAATTGQLVDEMHRGLHEATGASTMRFTRYSHETYQFAESNDMMALGYRGQDVINIASAVATRLPELVVEHVLRTDLPQTMLFMDGDTATRSDIQVRPLSTLAELIPTPALVVSPLHSAHEVVGAVVAIWPAPTDPEYITGCAPCFSRIVDLAGPVLHRLQSLERLEQHVAEIETIRRLTDSIARTPDLHEALGIVCRTAQLLTEQDFIGIAETATDHMIWRAAAGALDPAFLHQPIAVPNHVLKRMLHHRQEIVTENVRQDLYFRPEIMPIHMRENLRSSAIIPVYVNASLRAIMLFGSRQLCTYSSDDVANLHALAATAVTAIASADARLRTTGGSQT